MNKSLDWKFRPRRYPHFDHVIYHADEALKLIRGFQKLGEHAFLPFIECPIEVRRFSKHLEKVRLLEAGKDASDVRDRKPRPIKYASHQDSQIFSFYRAILAKEYESMLGSLDLQENVIAYRKIASEQNPDKGKCNIHFAKEAFDEITRRSQASVITLGIKGFFESLDHEFLKKQWCRLLNVKALPKDHEAVFSAITNYSVVNQRECFESLGLIKLHGTKREFLHCPFYIFDHKKMLCDKAEYREKIIGKGLVKKNDYGGKAYPQGIPQGSPISDILANLYMLDFDIEMKNLAIEKGAYYRRYSDDILWICSPDDEDYLIKKTESCVKKQGKETLIIGPEKTTRTIFRTDNDGLSYEGDPFSYLGFAFDGKKALYREKTISNYKRDAIFSIKSFVKRAHEKSVGNEQKKIVGNGKSLRKNLNISQIYHKVGYLNKAYIKRQREKLGTKRTEGNFMSYHLRAMKIFNDDTKPTYRLSDQQVRRYKNFIKNRIVSEARKFDPQFKL